MVRLHRMVLATSLLSMHAGAALGAPPPFTVASLARSGESVSGGVGPIAFRTNIDGQLTSGVLRVAVNNSGAWLLDVRGTNTGLVYDGALLNNTLGLNPYILEGAPGYLATPANDEAAATWSLSLNNAGNAGLGLATSFGGTNSVYFNATARPAAEGGAIVAAGLAAGTVWGVADANMRVQLNDANQMLVVSTIVESGASKRAVVVLQLDAAGTVTGTTLIAKEGGPVGAGPDTWATIAGGGEAAAMNNAGKVVFSGTTAGGVEGVYANGVGFVAVRGGPTPTSGLSWGALAGAPVDVNNNGVVALRGVLADGGGIYTETVEAGEAMDEAARTFGNGPLNRIVGTLSDDADVDMFRIQITDPANFSATTVPDGGSGFPGATFDTVLTLVASPENGTRGLAQCDDASAGVVQSTMTYPAAIAGREYYICISTPKSRCNARIRQYATNTFPNAEIWMPDPSGLAVAGGLVYWPDPSTDAIGRSTTGGAVQAPLAALRTTSHIAVDAAGGKVYWIDRGIPGQGDKIRRSNLDGSNIQEVTTAISFGTLAAYYGSGLTLDLVGGKVYWSRTNLGEINRCNLDGSNAERVIQDYFPTDALFPPNGAMLPAANFAPTSLAVDNAGGKLYFVNTFVNRIQRANLNGTGRTSLAVGAGAVQIALDTAAGKLYWTNTAASKIQSSNLDGTGLADVLSTPSPVAIALDGGFVYWTSTLDRVMRRATLAGAGAADVVALARETGVQAANGPGEGETFFAWVRSAAGAGGTLPYQIKLTGAAPRHESVMIAKGNTKVVAVGDVVPGTAPYSLTTVGSPDGALRITDRGDVLWRGVFFQPTIYDNYLYQALFFNGERVLTSMDIPPGATLGAQKLVDIYDTPYSLDVSDSGEYAMLLVNMQIPDYQFTAQPDNALLLRFTLPPACIGDFNQSGTITVQDIFDFLSAYFSSSPSADVNQSGAVTVQDIFDFLSGYFAGCP